MIVNAVTGATRTDPTAASATRTGHVAKSATASQQPTQSHSRPTTSAVKDTVHISPAQPALQEFVESPAQTAEEARSGDRQAQRLQAAETAARKS